MTFLTNTWYVACSAGEIDAKPLGRTICKHRVVFYRPQAGQVAAIEDFCPHRGAQLSQGSVRDGKLVCGYHGLEMGCDGKAVSMPGQRVGGFPAIRSFPVVERYGFIWLWPGDPSQADPALIPVMEWHDNPQWAYCGGHYHVKADYRLMIDNLMDLTHETYVHATSIGQKEIDETPCKTTVDGEHVTTSRFMDNVIAPPFYQAALRANQLADQVPVDRWQVCHFTPPSHVMIEVGVAHAGHGGYHAPPERKVYAVVVDFITPETDTSMWYYWGMARRFSPDDQELSARLLERQAKVFVEDLDVLERQQDNLTHHAGRKLLNLDIDAGGMRARQMIARLMAQESRPTPP